MNLRRRRRHRDHLPSPTTAIEYVFNCAGCGEVWTAVATGGDDAAFLCPVCGSGTVKVLDTRLRFEGGPP